MEKRLLLAIGLSLLVLLSWSALTPKPQIVVNKEVIAKESLAAIPAVSPSTSSLKLAEPVQGLENLIKIKQDLFDLVFVEQAAEIKEVVFKKYKNFTLPLKYGFLLNDKTLNFKKDSEASDSISFVSSDSQKTVTKKFIFNKASYSIGLEIKIQNLSTSPLQLNTPLILGILDFSNNMNSRFQDVTVATPDKIIHNNGRKNLNFSEIKFLSLRDRYFCAIIEPTSGTFSGFVNKFSGQESEIGLNSPERTIPAGGQIGQLYKIYLGPQDLKILNSIKSDWTAVIYYGTFDIISQVLLQTLDFLYRLLHSWGWAIIALSILIYLVLYPLSIKQMRSMKEMQAIQPQVEKLRVQYKDNPQKMNKEVMDLYRLHKVNPLGGCLPLILQMPIFFALYNALMRSIALRGAKFLWIKDLSEPDRLFTLPVTLPILGNDINILPIIMAIGMFIQQKVSMAQTSGGASAEQQKIMMIVMPVMFGFIFYGMPSGLVLYWLINSMLMLTFQIRMNKAK